MTVQQLINALEVIPEKWRGCAITLHAHGSQSEPVLIAVRPKTDNHLGEMIAVIQDDSKRPEGSEAPLLLIMPGRIVS